MTRADPSRSSTRLRLALWVLAGVVAAIGIAMAIATQSLLPLLYVVLGLALPMLPLGRRTH